MLKLPLTSTSNLCTYLKKQSDSLSRFICIKEIYYLNPIEHLIIWVIHRKKGSTLSQYIYLLSIYTPEVLTYAYIPFDSSIVGISNECIHVITNSLNIDIRLIIKRKPNNKYYFKKETYYC